MNPASDPLPLSTVLQAANQPQDALSQLDYSHNKLE